MFLAAADCELPHSDLYSLIVLLNYGGYDSSSVCDMESIQMNSLFLVVHLRATSRCFPHFNRCLYQPQFILLKGPNCIHHCILMPLPLFQS